MDTSHFAASHIVPLIALGFFGGAGAGAAIVYMVADRADTSSPYSQTMALPGQTSNEAQAPEPVEIEMPPEPDLTPLDIALPAIPTVNPVMPGGLTPPPILHPAPDKKLVPEASNLPEPPKPPQMPPTP